MKNTIRCVAMGVIEYQSKLLVYKAYEPFKNEYYYIPLGSSIEYRETSVNALRRAFLTELKINLYNIQLVSVIENLFEHRKKAKHEIVFLYKADVIEEYFYKETSLKVATDASIELAWISKKDFKSGRELIYPSEILDYL